MVAQHPFIELDQRGVAWVIGTTVKVREIVLDGMALDWNAHVLVEEFPHLSLVNVHAAFCYYFDHQMEMDEEIEEVDREVERWRLESPPGPTRAELLERLRLLESLPLSR